MNIRRYHIVTYCLFALCLLLVGPIFLGHYLNDFVIAQNGYMPTAREGITLEDNRFSASGIILKSIDKTTKFPMLGDVFRAEREGGRVAYYSIGDWLIRNRMLFAFPLSIVFIILFIVTENPHLYKFFSPSVKGEKIWERLKM